MGEREIGQILEGIKNLNTRYDKQETRLSRVEDNIGDLVTSFTAQPAKCLKTLEEKFVTKERIEPLENMHGTIKKAAIITFCLAITCLAVFLIYIKGQL